jgi:cytochrome c biogenesis protein CcmG/thiol:disulfide interchange protein DsbE
MVVRAPAAGSRDGLTTALAVAGIVVGLGVLPRILAGGVLSGTQAALVGKPAPAFSLPLVANAHDGQRTVALADMKGSAVVLDFWATFCRPCQAEAPILNGVANRFRDKGLAVIGIDTGERDGLAGPWARAHHIDYPIAFDANNDAAEQYGIRAMPTLVVISRTGEVIAMREGLTDADELESLVKKAL